MTTGKTIALTRRTLVGKVMSLLLSMLSRLVIAFLPRSKHLLISWLQSPSAVILEPPEIKSDTVSTVPHLAYNPVNIFCCCLVAKSCLTFCNSMDYSPPASSVCGISQARITGVGCHFLLQGIFLSQGSNLSLLYDR